MKLIEGETEVIIETPRRGKKPIKTRVIYTNAESFATYLNNKLLEAIREGKKLEVTTAGRTNG